MGSVSAVEEEGADD